VPKPGDLQGRGRTIAFDQAEFDIRCEWGLNGVNHLAPTSDAVIIVDVMSFSTAVVVAVARGAIVYPYRGSRDLVGEFARSVDAELAGPRGECTYSLSPASLLAIPAGTRLVLPSPNGSTLSLSTGDTPTLAGCLRNAASVAQAALTCGKRISVIPAGERWWEDGSLRPALEDLIGAGAIVRRLPGALSPEAEAALSTYTAMESHLLNALQRCSSGEELIAMGFEQDVDAVAEVDVDDCAPLLKEGAYRRA
jgi:2-phosphosulfolactate phosphatase